MLGLVGVLEAGNVAFLMNYVIYFMLAGSIPLKFGSLAALKYLSLSGNKLSGEFLWRSFALVGRTSEPRPAKTRAST